MSGHALLITFFIVHRLSAGRTRRIHSVELLLAIALWFVVVFMKLVVWTDPLTLVSGVLLALVMFEAGRRIVRSRVPATERG